MGAKTAQNSIQGLVTALVQSFSAIPHFALAELADDSMSLLGQRLTAEQGDISGCSCP